MAASIRKVVSPAQGVAHFERLGYYAKNHPLHREASVWTGRSADTLGRAGPVGPDTFTAILGNGGAKLVHGSGGIVSLRAEQNSAT